jgi:hypothetical protein
MKPGGDAEPGREAAYDVDLGNVVRTVGKRTDVRTVETQSAVCW